MKKKNVKARVMAAVLLAFGVIAAVCRAELSGHPAAEGRQIRKEFLTVNEGIFEEYTKTVSKERNNKKGIIAALLSGESLLFINTDITIWGEAQVPEVNAKLKDSYLTVKISSDSENDHCLVNLDAARNGTNVISGSLVKEKETVGISFPGIEQGYYILNREMVQEYLKDLLQGGMPGESMQENGEAAGGSAAKGQNLETIKDILTIVAGAVTEKNVTCTENAVIEQNEMGKTFTGKDYKCTPSAQDIADVLVELADYMDAHEEARTCLDQYLEPFTEAVPQAQRLRELLLSDTQTLRANAEEYGNAFAALDLSLEIGTDSEQTDRLWKLSFVKNNVPYSLEYNENTKNGIMAGIHFDDFVLQFSYEKTGEQVSALGVPYGNYMLRAYNEGDTAQPSITLAVTQEDAERDAHTLSFYGGSTCGNVTLHIDTSKEGSAKEPDKTNTVDAADADLADTMDILDIYKEGFYNAFRQLIG